MGNIPYWMVSGCLLAPVVGMGYEGVSFMAVDPAPNIQPVPFVPYKEEEEREDRKRLTVHFNAADTFKLAEARRTLTCRDEGTALKAMAWIGLNVAGTVLGADFCRYFFKKERSRINAKGSYPALMSDEKEQI